MSDLTTRPMTRPELNLALDWAAREGWNPGRADADAFWAADPDGFLVAERNGEVVGTGSAVSYDGRFGFFGLFIVRPDLRKRGYGRELWADMVLHMRGRLLAEAAMGLDGVFAMQANYEKAGFQLAGKDVRFEGVGERKPAAPEILPAARIPFANLTAFDAEHFPAPRPKFLASWIKAPGAGAFVIAPRGPSGKLGGFAVVRPCRTGFKIGPLFARDAATAEKLFTACSAHAAGQPLFLDVPEANAPALELARGKGLKEVFGCARMYQGAAPNLNHAGVFGVTSFELG